MTSTTTIRMFLLRDPKVITKNGWRFSIETGEQAYNIDANLYRKLKKKVQPLKSGGV